MLKTLYFVELTYGNAIIDESGNMIQYTHENDGVISYNSLKPLMDHAGVIFIDIGAIDPTELGLDEDDCDEQYYKYEQLYRTEFLRRINEKSRLTKDD